MSKEKARNIFHIAVIFIGTIVGAGLASGKEITQFFTSFGLKSFFGIILCGFLYIIVCNIISKISMKYKLESYSDVMHTVSPNILGKITEIITTLYLISSASIILAGSGALINQFFGIPKIIGTFLMIILAIIFLLRGTDGLIQINSFIVPTLIITISIITILYFIFCNDAISFESLKAFPPKKNGILISTILYTGYNILCSCGVLVPISTRINDRKTITIGILFGAGFLTMLSLMINLVLSANQPYIYNYEIPLLFVSNRFGPIIQAILLIVILMEMFSTEVSDVYSISKTLKQKFNIKFNNSIFIVLLIALPISQIGFTYLISILDRKSTRLNSSH